jgi:DNA-binding protein HU-beta
MGLKQNKNNETVNKTELIKLFAEEASLQKKQATELVDIFLDIITDSLTNHKDVKIIGFGAFKVSMVKAKTVTNPQSKKKMKIDSYYRVRFIPGQALKDTVNNKNDNRE